MKIYRGLTRIGDVNDEMPSLRIITEPHPADRTLRRCTTFPLRLQIVKHHPDEDTEFVDVRARYSATRGTEMCVGQMLDEDAGIESYVDKGLSGSEDRYALFSNDFSRVSDVRKLKCMQNERCCRTAL